MTSSADVWERRFNRQWPDDCIRWHGRELIGEYSHYCADWDFLPIDETTAEWEACTCYEQGDD